MIKVAMVTPRFTKKIQGGGEISCKLLVDTLRKQGIKVDVFTGDELFPEIKNTWKLNIAMYKYLRKITNEYDIWHTYNMALLPAVGLLTKKYNINSVANLNGCSFIPTLAISNREQILLTFVLKSLIRHIKKFVTLSGWYKEMWVKSGLPQEKIQLIPNMIAKNFVFNKKKSDNTTNIIAVGGYAKIRNFKMLLNAYSKLPKQNVTLTIVGQGWNNIIASYKGKNIVVYRQQVEHNDLKVLYALADIYVQPYDCSAIGRTLLEAAQNKTAIVTTGKKQDFPYLHKYLNYFENADMLRRTLQILINNKGVREKQGENVCRIVNKYYSPENIASKYIDLYKKLLQR